MVQEMKSFSRWSQWSWKL